MPSSDGFTQKVGTDGTPVGTRAILDIFFDANLGPIMVDASGNFWRLTVDTNGALGTQQVTI